MSSPEIRIIQNGVFRDASSIALDGGDGLLRFGHGAFETLSAYHGRHFLFEPHFQRLQTTARFLGLSCPDEAELSAAIDRLLAANDSGAGKQTRLRITLSAPASGDASWWIEATAPPRRPETARVGTGAYFRNERSPLSGHKTTCCAENVLADRAAKAAGLDEMLFLNTRGELCEGTWSNVFVRDEAGWKTPPLDSGCLSGITRALVLDLAREAGIEIVESTLSLPTLLGQTLNRVQSAFLTSSIREIQPVASLDGKDLEIAAEIQILQSAYRKRVELECAG